MTKKGINIFIKFNYQIFFYNLLLGDLNGKTVDKYLQKRVRTLYFKLCPIIEFTDTVDIGYTGVVKGDRHKKLFIYSLYIHFYLLSLQTSYGSSHLTSNFFTF
jgi:hypothetical protein